MEIKNSNRGNDRLCQICGTIFDEDGFCSNGHEKDEPQEKKLQPVEQLIGRCLVCNKPILPEENFCSHCD